MSIVSVILDRILNHLDSNAGSKYDSTTALNVADVPKGVDTNDGERITIGHPKFVREDTVSLRTSNLLNSFRPKRNILVKYNVH